MPSRSVRRPLAPRIDARVLKHWYPIERVIAPYVERFYPAGSRQLKAICPLHDEHTPSFYVRPDLGLFHCFGCQQGGDIFTFLQLMHACDFRTAVDRLLHAPVAPVAPAGRSLLTPVAPTALTDRQLDVLTAVAVRYAERLDQVRRFDAALAGAPTRAAMADLLAAAEPSVRAGLRALAYLRGRGVTDAVLGPARVGWCGGDDLAPLAHAQGWTQDELLVLGLLRMPRENDSAEAWPAEHLTGRIVVPVIEHGRCPWLTGRLPYEPRQGSRSPKYLGLRGVHKRPFGLTDASGRAEVLLVEGALDWLVAVQWQLPPPVALDGLALRPADFRRLSRATRVFLWLDRDGAGQQALHGEPDRGEPGLGALFGRRALAVVTPGGAKDLAGLAVLPDGRDLAWAALGAACSLATTGAPSGVPGPAP